MPIKMSCSFMPEGMKNTKYKVPMRGSGSLGGFSCRSVVGEKLYVWSLQNGGCGRENVMR